MAAKKKVAARKRSAERAANGRKPRATVKKAVVKKKVARTTVVPPAVADLDNRIAILRSNLRDLTEQAAASSGASTEELLSQRIGTQEAKLQLLIKERDELVRRGS